jgi:hypothetical protein
MRQKKGIHDPLGRMISLFHFALGDYWKFRTLFVLGFFSFFGLSSKHGDGGE